MSGGLSEVQRKRFDRWYKTYPRKVGKGQALRAWAKIKPSDALTDEMISAVKKQVEWRDKAPAGAFVPEWKHPSTWLNALCWEDEVEQWPEQKKPEPSEYEEYGDRARFFQDFDKEHGIDEGEIEEIAKRRQRNAQSSRARDND